MTSNLGFQAAPPEWQAKGKSFADWLDHVTGLGPDALKAALKPLLATRFMPEFLARLTLVPFYPIGPEAMRDIVRLKLNKIVRRMAQTSKVELTYDTAVVDSVAARCTEVQTGARNVDHILSGTLLPRISRELLTRMTGGEAPTALAVGVGEDGDFAFRFR
jgi:type VI secretion system protein VasG